MKEPRFKRCDFPARLVREKKKQRNGNQHNPYTCFPNIFGSCYLEIHGMFFVYRGSNFVLAYGEKPLYIQFCVLFFFLPKTIHH